MDWNVQKLVLSFKSQIWILSTNRNFYANLVNYKSMWFVPISKLMLLLIGYSSEILM